MLEVTGELLTCVHGWTNLGPTGGDCVALRQIRPNLFIVSCLSVPTYGPFSAIRSHTN